uniref:Uncharacterized protein n=1 Tax=Rhizophora mucronata TaxID=61149 RepID=A0A2P2NDJ3_RHIMU
MSEDTESGKSVRTTEVEEFLLNAVKVDWIIWLLSFGD